MIIVAGHLLISEGKRQEFLDASYPSVIEARVAAGCRDFVVSADPIEVERVNVYEAWDTEAQLLEFRGSGPSDDMNSLIVSASVSQYEVR